MLCCAFMVRFLFFRDCCCCFPHKSRYGKYTLHNTRIKKRINSILFWCEFHSHSHSHFAMSCALFLSMCLILNMFYLKPPESASMRVCINVCVCLKIKFDVKKMFTAWCSKTIKKCLTILCGEFCFFVLLFACDIADSSKFNINMNWSI